MALVEIEYGSLASSEVMNNNFEYLDNKITDVSSGFNSQLASINSSIASVNATISNDKSNLLEEMNSLNEEINDKMSTLFSESGLYVTTYINGTSWYREYFSDSDKSNRIWLEQGGRVNSIGQDSAACVAFLKPFSNANYYVNYANGYGANDASRGMSTVYDLFPGSFSIRNGNDAGIVAIWYACGK